VERSHVERIWRQENAHLTGAADFDASSRRKYASVEKFGTPPGFTNFHLAVRGTFFAKLHRVS